MQHRSNSNTRFGDGEIQHSRSGQVDRSRHGLHIPLSLCVGFGVFIMSTRARLTTKLIKSQARITYRWCARSRRQYLQFGFEYARQSKLSLTLY